MQVVFVEWLDSHSVSGASATSARKEGLLLMATAGLLVGEDDQVLRLALDWWSWEDDGDLVERYRNLAIIPKAAIQRRRQWDAAPEPVAPDTTSEASGSLDQCNDGTVTPWFESVPMPHWDRRFPGGSL